MFKLFQYFIYYVERDLDEYDPSQDMLVRMGAFLTWRRFDQRVPTSARLYAGAVKDREDANWMIWRLNPQLHFAGVEGWLENVSDDHSLGPWKASEFRGLFGADLGSGWSQATRDEWCLKKLNLAEAFFRRYLISQDAYFNFPGLYSGARPAVDQRLKHVRTELLPHLLDVRGQLLDNHMKASTVRG